jgi:hypothetical protein
MTYQDLNINQRINAKGNAMIFFMWQSGVNPLIKRISSQDPMKFVPSALWLDLKFEEPKNAGKPKY